MTGIGQLAIANHRLRSLFGQLRVANGRIGHVIGHLWLHFGGLCQGLFTLRFVKHGIGKMYRRIRNFLIRIGVRIQRDGDGLKRLRIRFKPHEEKVKEMLKWRFFAKNGSLINGEKDGLGNG